MWSLGRVIRNPEVTRVYMGSFWDQPLRYDYFKDLFAVEQMDLFADLRGLPANSLLRKINDLVRRAHVSKAHALLLSYLRKQIPKMFGKQKKQQELLDSMPEIFQQLQTEHRLPPSRRGCVSRSQATSRRWIASCRWYQTWTSARSPSTSPSCSTR